MNLLVLGINGKSMPVRLRERLSLTPEEQKRLLAGLCAMEGVLECAVLSTCSRTELHVRTAEPMRDASRLETFLCGLKGVDCSEVKKFFLVYEGLGAIQHILKVASGMDSPILGEDQILGQFKQAYCRSREVGASKAVLNTLSRLAITSSKKIKTRQLSLCKAASLAVRVREFLLARFHGVLNGRRILMIGSGEIGRMVVQELLQAGADSVFMTTRSCMHGKVLPSNDEQCQTTDIEQMQPTCDANSQRAGEEQNASSVRVPLPVSVTPVDYMKRHELIQTCDIIIGATSSPHYTVTADMLVDLSCKSGQSDGRIFLDLAVPRDFDEAIGSISGNHLYDIDDLSAVEAGRPPDVLDLAYVDEQLDAYVAEFVRWQARRRDRQCGRGA